jgi:hypothetical protein
LETPNEYELSILDGTLTPDQKRTLHLMLQAGAVSGDSGEPEENDELLKYVKQLKANGARLPDILKDQKVKDAGISKMSELAALLKGA